MKAVPITSILCGTALIIAPLVDNIITMQMLVSLMQQGREHVSLSGELSTSHASWCMLFGACAIVSGLVCGLRSRNTSGGKSAVISASAAAPGNASPGTEASSPSLGSLGLSIL